MKQQIVKIPEHEMPVALGRSRAAFAGARLEENSTIEKEPEEFGRQRGAGPVAEVSDLLGRRECRQGGGYKGIANPEQGACARRFENEVFGAPPQIGEA
jgi:hypothetical protein